MTDTTMTDAQALAAGLRKNASEYWNHEITYAQFHERAYAFWYIIDKAGLRLEVQDILHGRANVTV